MRILIWVLLVANIVFLTNCGDDDGNGPNPTDGPFISSTSANIGAPGDVLIINGSKFGTQSLNNFVSFGGTKAISQQQDIVSWNDTKIEVKIPLGAKSGKLFVMSEDKKSNEVDFSLSPATFPIIDNIEPGFGDKGSEVTIIGKNFGSSRGSSFVMFQFVKVVESDYLSWSNNEIKVKIPPTAISGTVTINVSSKINPEYYFNVSTTPSNPQFTNLSKTTFKVNESIVITGKKFRGVRGQSYIKINDVKLPDANYEYWSDSRIDIIVPQNTETGSMKVYVSYGANEVQSNTQNFTIDQGAESGPAITSINPTEASIGETITVKGKNFGLQTQGYVNLNGVRIDDQAISSWTTSQIVFTVPTGSTTGPVEVNVLDKKSNSIILTIKSIVNTDPMIEFLDQTIITVGQNVAVNGKNFGNSQGKNFVAFNGVNATEYQSWSDTKIIVKVPANATSGKVTVSIGGKVSNGIDITIKSVQYSLEMVEIPAGSFKMGIKNDDWDAFVHDVTITKAFLMSKYEITQKLWKKVKNQSDPSKFKGDNHPVEQISWHDAVQFCNLLSDWDGLDKCYTIEGNDVTCDFTKNGYRLPTEAEWELAARAGETADAYADPSKYAWTNIDTKDTHEEVGLKEANSLGLYDIIGNVSEWVWDWYHDEYYLNSPKNDPMGPSSGMERVYRGGSYQDGADNIRFGARFSNNSNYKIWYLGLRVVRNK